MGEIERIANMPEWTSEQNAKFHNLKRELRLLKKATEVREERLQAVEAESRIGALQDEIATLKEGLRKLIVAGEM